MARTIKPDKPTFFDSTINIKVSFKSEESLTLKTTGMYLGKVKLLVYTYNPSRTLPFIIQSLSLEFKSNLGCFKTEKECIKFCQRVAKAYIDLLES
jgi:hypothetical protein